MSERVVIVGASLAGLTTAEALRDEGYPGSITIIGEEPHLPYSRPPLSKQVLSGEWSEDKTTLRDEPALKDLDVTLLLGRSATAVNLPERVVRVGDYRLPFDSLVAATGVRASVLHNPRQLRGVHSLRTLDDARALRAALPTAIRVAVIGAGILGCEIASALVDAGHEVTLIGRTAEPRFDGTGGHLSARIAGLLRSHGVELRMGVEVTGLGGADAVTSVRLSDHTEISTDLVVAAIGSTPVVDWMRGVPVDLSDGILCDAHGVASSRIYAVGDVARWQDPLTRVARRVEHQATAIEQGRAVGKLIATGQPSPAIVPFFWAELFHERILVHGRLSADIRPAILAGDPANGGFVASTVHNGRTAGIVGWNLPREFRRERAKALDSTREPPAF